MLAELFFGAAETLALPVFDFLRDFEAGFEAACGTDFVPPLVFGADFASGCAFAPALAEVSAAAFLVAVLALEVFGGEDFAAAGVVFLPTDVEPEVLGLADFLADCCAVFEDDFVAEVVD